MTPPVRLPLELVAQALSAIPLWLLATVLIVLALVFAVGWAIPRVLRALDDHLVVKKASEQINSEKAALAALRITRPPRRRSITTIPARRRRSGRRP